MNAGKVSNEYKVRTSIPTAEISRLVYLCLYVLLSSNIQLLKLIGLVQFTCFSVSAANAVNFSSYILRAAKGAPPNSQTKCGGSFKFFSTRIDEEWKNKGISITTVTCTLSQLVLFAHLTKTLSKVVCLCHAFAPKLGIRLSNLLGAFKIIVLLVIIFTGFAAIGGRLSVLKPDNFGSFDGAGNACGNALSSGPSRAANHALALQQVLETYCDSSTFSETLQVLYANSGWESANYVSSTPFEIIFLIRLGSH